MGEDNNQNSIIKIAVGVMVTLAVITAVIALIYAAFPALDKATKKQDTITQRMDTMEYKSFDDKDVDGSTVISEINSAASKDFTIKVQTNDSTGSQEYNDKTKYNETDPAQSDYIEPTGTFHANLTKSTNKAVIGIEFVQDGYVKPGK